MVRKLKQFKKVPTTTKAIKLKFKTKYGKDVSFNAVKVVKKERNKKIVFN